jgi:hypothetical protein
MEDFNVSQQNCNVASSLDGHKSGKKKLGETPKKGSGCFRIPRQALDILIRYKASAWQIGVFLTIAKYTDESGKFSTAGYQAIYKATGASPGTERKPGRGRQLSAELLKIGRYDKEPVKPRKKNRKLSGILYTPEEWHNKTGESIPEIPHELHSVRWILNDFETDDWVWFPNSLIEGYGRFKKPLKRLKQCGDVAGRLLVLLYSVDNMEEYGGVPPLHNVYREYNLEHLGSDNGFTFWTAQEGTNYSWPRLSRPSIGIDSCSEDVEQKKKQLDTFWNSLSSLENAGFLYECVTAMDGSEINVDTRPLYDITARPRHGHPPKGEEGLLKRINRIFEKMGYRHADDSGRYHGKYPVLSLVGVQPQVIGIYRLRFRLTNPKNYPVRAAWVRIQEDRNDWQEHFEQLEKVLGIGQEKQPLFDHYPIPEEGQNYHDFDTISDDMLSKFD